MEPFREPKIFSRQHLRWGARCRGLPPCLHAAPFALGTVMSRRSASLEEAFPRARGRASVERLSRSPRRTTCCLGKVVANGRNMRRGPSFPSESGRLEVVAEFDPSSFSPPRGGRSTSRRAKPSRKRPIVGAVRRDGKKRRQYGRPNHRSEDRESRCRACRWKAPHANGSAKRFAEHGLFGHILLERINIPDAKLPLTRISVRRRTKKVRP